MIKTTVSNWLSFLQTTDIYDPDRLEADRDLLRRFYLKHGFADVRILSAMGEYDPARRGFVVTFTIDEGAAISGWHGRCHLERAGAGRADAAIQDCGSRAGDVYNADAGREDRRRHDHRGRQARLRLRLCAPAGGAKFRNQDHQSGLHRRRGRARLHRAHQYSRQYAARATTSFAANSISARATPITAR